MSFAHIYPKLINTLLTWQEDLRAPGSFPMGSTRAVAAALYAGTTSQAKLKSLQLFISREKEQILKDIQCNVEYTRVKMSQLF